MKKFRVEAFCYFLTHGCETSADVGTHLSIMQSCNQPGTVPGTSLNLGSLGFFLWGNR